MKKGPLYPERVPIELMDEMQEDVNKFLNYLKSYGGDFASGVDDIESPSGIIIIIQKWQEDNAGEHLISHFVVQGEINVGALATSVFEWIDEQIGMAD